MVILEAVVHAAVELHCVILKGVANVLSMMNDGQNDGSGLCHDR